MPFKAWVPNVTGNLSFSIIGTGKNPKKIFKTYKITRRERFTVVVERRMTSDSAFAVDRFVRKRPRFFHFIFLAVSSRETKHNLNRGSVFVCDSREYGKVSYLVSQLSNDVSSEDFSERFFDSLNGLKWAAMSEKCAWVPFELHRSGELTIYDSKQPVFDPQNDNWGTLENQVFYFIRDIAHRHQHHEPTSDTILKAYDYTERPEYSRLRWKRETLYALFRWVIQQKRTLEPNALTNCLGVLAYAESFKKHLVSKEDELTLPNYYSKAVIESINASLIAAKESKSISYSETFWTYVIPLLSAIIAVFGIMAAGFNGHTNTPPQNWQTDLTSNVFAFLQKNPILALLIGTSPLLFHLVSRLFKKFLFPKLRGLQRVILASGYWYSSGFFTILFVTSVYYVFLILGVDLLGQV